MVGFCQFRNRKNWNNGGLLIK